MSMGKVAFGVLLVVSLAIGFGVFAHLDTGDANMWSGSGVSKIVIEEESLDVLDERYTPEEERAWCVYGEVREEEEGRKVAFVEEIRWNSKAEGTKTSVEFNCLRDLSVPEGTEYLGHVHSHPPDSAAEPSAQDEALNHASGIEVMGVYNGDELNFYAGEDISRAIDGDTDVEPIEVEVA